MGGDIHMKVISKVNRDKIQIGEQYDIYSRIFDGSVLVQIRGNFIRLRNGEYTIIK